MGADDGTQHMFNLCVLPAGVMCCLAGDTFPTAGTAATANNMLFLIFLQLYILFLLNIFSPFCLATLNNLRFCAFAFRLTLPTAGAVDGRVWRLLPFLLPSSKWEGTFSSSYLLRVTCLGFVLLPL